MKYKVRFGLALGVATLLLAALPLTAQSPGTGCKNMPNYDAEAEIVVRGAVEKIEEVSCCPGNTGIHLVLESSEGLYEVHLGPSWFVSEEKEFAVAVGDQLVVTGSPFSPSEGPEALAAREVVRGDETLTLRDESGRPAWAGRGGSRKSGR